MVISMLFQYTFIFHNDTSIICNIFTKIRQSITFITVTIINGMFFISDKMGLGGQQTEEYVCQLSELDKKKALEELREDANIREQSLQQMRDWIGKHPNIKRCRTGEFSKQLNDLSCWSNCILSIQYTKFISVRILSPIVHPLKNL